MGAVVRMVMGAHVRMVAWPRRRYRKERTTTLSNCAEVCLRTGDAESAVFFTTSAMDSEVVLAKTAARRVRAIHMLLSERAWYPRGMEVLKQGFWLPSVLAARVKVAAAAESNARGGAPPADPDLQTDVRHAAHNDRRHEWLAGGAFDGGATDPSLLWLLVVYADTETIAGSSRVRATRI